MHRIASETTVHNGSSSVDLAAPGVVDVDVVEDAQASRTQVTVTVGGQVSVILVGQRHRRRRPDVEFRCQSPSDARSTAGSEVGRSQTWFRQTMALGSASGSYRTTASGRHVAR